MLRDGPALAIPDRDGETGPATRLWREGILIPDLIVAFEINVAGVIARRGYPIEIAWRPRVPGVGGRSPGKSKARARRRGYGVLARDADAKGQWRYARVILAPCGFPAAGPAAPAAE